MLVEFVLADHKNDSHMSYLYELENNLELEPLRRPRFSEKEIIRHTKEEIVANIAKHQRSRVHHYLIFADKEIVGEVSMQINPPQMSKHDLPSSWLGIAISDKNFWGKGVAKLALEFALNWSKENNLKRMELGVFEYNHRALSFYKKMGFKELTRIKEFTFYDEKFWDDIRMEIEL